MIKKLELRKTFITIIFLNIVQIGASIAIAVYALYAKMNNLPIFTHDSRLVLIYVIAAAALVNSLITIRDLYILAGVDSQHQMLIDTISRMEDLNTTLIAQRHDFLNHLQVVYGLVEMDEYDEAKSYMEKIYSSIQKISRILKTSNPAINALLQAKTIDCDKRGIEMKLNVTSSFSGLKIASWEMCRVLGNIIDNSIDALNGLDKNKLITVELSEDLKQYDFRIRNNGPQIPQKHLDKIFLSGFTTKAGKGEGMGLCISQQIMKENGGSISVQSGPHETIFEGVIPK